MANSNSRTAANTSLVVEPTAPHLFADERVGTLTTPGDDAVRSYDTDDSVHPSSSPSTTVRTKSLQGRSTSQHFPILPASDDSLLKTPVNIAADEVSSTEARPRHLSTPFKRAQAVLRQVGAFRIPFVRRIWSEVSEDPEKAPEGSSEAPHSTWMTTVFRIGPLAGLFSMLTAISAMITSLGVLVGSNGRPVVNWSVPPSTYLAVLTAIANLGMRYACEYRAGHVEA